MKLIPQIPAQPAMRLIRTLASEGDRIVTMERARALAPTVGLSSSYLRQALHHLTKSGWLVRLRQGLYALAATVPGVSGVHEFEIAMKLVPSGAISHRSALHHHGLTEQAPRKVFVLTTIGTPIPQSHHAANGQGGIPIGETIYQFIRVKPDRFFGTQKIWVGEARVTITDPERTLLDGLMIPQYCGDFAEVLHAFAVRGETLDLKRIIDYALKLDAATIKRLGWVLQHQGIEASRLQPLLDVPIKGYRTLDPSGPRQGPCNRQWMIQENLPGKVAS
ncbi:MAG: type IV toxin-antitoxin system AbiEi family antitoxin domain-containing protein [Phycisphaerales bacterium]|nr:type IV toxin-antitoxin system AbiEi family antitoxin domain-containing protein [Phycisphaerales bacterium]